MIGADVFKTRAQEYRDRALTCGRPWASEMFIDLADAYDVLATTRGERIGDKPNDARVDANLGSLDPRGRLASNLTR
jgi:hypothetical protein